MSGLGRSWAKPGLSCSEVLYLAHVIILDDMSSELTEYSQITFLSPHPL